MGVPAVLSGNNGEREFGGTGRRVVGGGDYNSQHAFRSAGPCHSGGGERCMPGVVVPAGPAEAGRGCRTTKSVVAGGWGERQSLFSWCRSRLSPGGASA